MSSIYKLKRVDLEEFFEDLAIKRYLSREAHRGMNTFPERPPNGTPPDGFEEVGYDEVRRAYIYTPIFHEWRQAVYEGEVMNFRMDWFSDGTGIAIHYGNSEPRYFRFGCKHEFETTRKEMCYWEGVCKKCGCTSSIDSSG